MKFKHLEKWMWDYNAIPDGPVGKLALEGINAKGVNITTGGLQHLGILSSYLEFMLSEVAECNETCIKLAQENSQHLVTLPLVSLPNDA